MPEATTLFIPGLRIDRHGQDDLMLYPQGAQGAGPGIPVSWRAMHGMLVGLGLLDQEVSDQPAPQPQERHGDADATAAGKSGDDDDLTEEEAANGRQVRTTGAGELIPEPFAPNEESAVSAYLPTQYAPAEEEGRQAW